MIIGAEVGDVISSSIDTDTTSSKVSIFIRLPLLTSSIGVALVSVTVCQPVVMKYRATIAGVVCVDRHQTFKRLLLVWTQKRP